MGLHVERGLSVEDLCAEKNDIFEILVAEIFCSPLKKIYVRETTTILRIFEFTNVSGHKSVPSYRLSTSVLCFFMRTTKV